MTLGSSALGLTVATASESDHLCMRKGQLQHCDPSHYYWVSNTLGFNGNPPRAGGGSLGLSGGHTTSDCTERHTLHSSTVCTTVPSLVTPAYAGTILPPGTCCNCGLHPLLRALPAPAPRDGNDGSMAHSSHRRLGRCVSVAASVHCPVSSRRSTLAALLLAPCASCKLNLGWLSERRN